MRRTLPTLPSGRMEAFSDGVIAVIITIMVLELHVPVQDGMPALRELAPHLGIYLLSFLLTGIYWLNHHELVRRTERVNYRCLLANLLWLFALSLTPLATAYVAQKHFSSFAVVLYVTVNMLTATTFGVLRITLMRVKRSNGSIAFEDREEARKHLLSLVLMLAAFPAAFWHPLLALLLTTGVVLIWIAPWLATRAPSVHEQPEEHALHPESR